MNSTSSTQTPRRIINGPHYELCSKMEINKVVSTTGDDTTTRNNNNNNNKHAPDAALKTKSRRRRRRKPRYGNTNIRLPAGFQPTENTIICGRSRQSFDSEGNKRLRTLVKTFLDDYVKATEKQEKSDILSNIVKEIRSRSPEGAFVKQMNGSWFEVGDAYAREKVGAQFREFLHTQYRSSVKSKLERKRKRKEEQQKQIQCHGGENSLSSARLVRFRSCDSSNSSSSSFSTSSDNSRSSSSSSSNEGCDQEEESVSTTEDITMSTIFQNGTPGSIQAILESATIADSAAASCSTTTVVGSPTGSSLDHPELLHALIGLPENLDIMGEELEITSPEPIRECLASPADLEMMDQEEHLIDDIISDLAIGIHTIPHKQEQQKQQQEQYHHQQHQQTCTHRIVSFFDIDDQTPVMLGDNGGMDIF